jgi:hypothetical protein
MNAERASNIAKLVLKTLHPGISLEDIYKVIPTLDDQFNELTVAVIPVLKEYEDKVEALVKTKVSEAIKNGNFSQASDLAKRTIEKDITISTLT